MMLVQVHWTSGRAFLCAAIPGRSTCWSRNLCASCYRSARSKWLTEPLYRHVSAAIYPRGSCRPQQSMLCLIELMAPCSLARITTSCGNLVRAVQLVHQCACHLFSKCISAGPFDGLTLEVFCPHSKHLHLTPQHFRHAKTYSLHSTAQIVNCVKLFCNCFHLRSSVRMGDRSLL